MLQPCDFGFLNDKKVLQVIRRKDAAVHFTLEPLIEGDKVQQKIDWDRRFDHMQQHSGKIEHINKCVNHFLIVFI